MTSARYLILVVIYIIGYFYTDYHKNDEKITIFHVPLFILTFSTFIFFYVVKYLENKDCTKNKLESKYILSQSIFYSILAVLSQYLYDFFLEKECFNGLFAILKNKGPITYIPEAFFVAGIVLLTNQLSYIIYPKCQ